VKLGKGARNATETKLAQTFALVSAAVNVDGSPHRGGMLGSESMSAMRSCLNEILLEFQEDSRGGARTLQNILHYMWSLNLDVRSKTSCTSCGV
jgi:hypothetical protein